jgi:hypothetical protein
MSLEGQGAYQWKSHLRLFIADNICHRIERSYATLCRLICELLNLVVF